LEARCLLEEGDRAAALIRLHEALTLAEQGNHRYYLRFCDWSMPIMFALALNHRIHPELVIGLIRTFRLRAPPHASDHWPWPVRVHTLGRFEIEVDGQPLTFSRKLPRKTLLLLKAIAAHGPRELAEQVLCDQLWEDEDGDAAHNALSITVLRLRKLVGRADAVLQQGGKLCLNRECCWVDAWSFEANVSRDALAEALELYLGIFLPEEEEKVWSVLSRERLRAKFIQALLRRGAALEQQGQFVEALACYVRGMDADAIVEDFSLGAMRCYEQLDRRTEAFSVYRRLKHTLSVVLGVTPSESTQRLFAEMLERQRHSAAS
jgi:DNA-binding SARP family transcriptional activator